MQADLKVSVVIPAYNSAETILRALSSVMAQTRPADEIIVVDDCSTDETRNIASATASRTLRVIGTQTRRGAGGARNAGIAAARGDIIAFLDSDDEWLPAKLERQVEMLASDRRLSFVACASSSISADGVDLGDTYGMGRIATGSDAWKALLACNFVATPSVIVWRRHLLALNGFDETLKIGEDQDLWVKLALTGSLGYVPDTLVRVHLRNDSLSSWMLDDLLTFTMPMIERHLSRQSHRLTRADIRRIRGERLNRFGRVAYVRGDIIRGARLIARSMMLGYQPLASTLYLLRAAPPLLWAKRQLEIGAAA